MDYLHLFSSEREHANAWMDLNVYNEPWVSYDTESYHVLYNHTVFDKPRVTFINNCNSEEYAYFRTLKEKSDSPSNTEAENVIFKTYLVSHTVSGNTITFTYSTPTDDERLGLGCKCNDMVYSSGLLTGNEIFIDNKNGTYTQSSKWKTYQPETDQPWVPKT